MAIVPVNPILSPMLNEGGPALLADENGNHLRCLGVVAVDVNGHSGFTAGVLADGKVSQVTGRQGDAVVNQTGQPAIPVIALVGLNPVTGAPIPFVAGSSAKVTGKFQSAVLVGTGAVQDIAHGLGVVPSLVLVSVQNTDALASWSIVEGIHTSTNLLVTVTTGVSYKVIAFA